MDPGDISEGMPETEAGATQGKVFSGGAAKFWITSECQHVFASEG